MQRRPRPLHSQGLGRPSACGRTVTDGHGDAGTPKSGFGDDELESIRMLTEPESCHQVPITVGHREHCRPVDSLAVTFQIQNAKLS